MCFKKRLFLLFPISIFLSFERNAVAQSDTFHYISDNIQHWTVPGCVTQVTVQLWAAGGGGGDEYYGYTGEPTFDRPGGSGAYYEGVLSGLTRGTVLNLYVPSGGKYTMYEVSGAGGWPGGGRGGCDTSGPDGLKAGGGGGYAAIQINGTYYVLAGAGGGAGGSPTPPYHYGGSGGAPTGGNGGNEVYYGGFGGTISSGGRPGYSWHFCDSGTSGMAFTGGMGGGLPSPCDSLYGGGGGGGGYYGGGGGGDLGEGGGGGSSYPGSTFTSGGITFTPISNLQGNIDSSIYDVLAPGSPPDSTIGIGGWYKNGGNGLIIIYTGIFPLKSAISVQINPTCGICNGIVTVTPSAGRSPYTYSWSPSGQTTATATGLCANTYTVTVSDSCGDVSTASVVLVAVPLSVTANVNTNVKCNGNCIGSATAAVAIGTSPYTYTWAPSGGSKATATGLCAGVYTVTVKDANGCTGSATATITQPTQVIAKILSITNPLCNAGMGSISANASGGVSPYTYKWSPGNQTTATATGLIAGSYTLTVSDSSGCTGTTSAIITQPTLLTATISTTNHVPCNGGVGNATVTAGGGTSPYTYLWNPTSQTTAAATGLAAGVYTIKISDNNGCTATNTVTITQPAVLTATMGIPNRILCNGGTGNVTVAVSGGTNPYTYLWTPSAETNALATGLYVGTYTVNVTDDHHCTASASVIITQPAVLTATVTSTTSISCTNGNNGTATAKGGGGIAPYTYLWTPSAETNATATNLFAGSYTVTITDANGCAATATTALSQPTPVTATISEPKIICKDSTGILIANPSGGTPGYKYAWSSGGTLGIATITPTFTNDYSVTVTDANGCTGTANIVLQYGPSFAVAITGKRSVCVGDSTTICANAIGAIDGVTYLWEPENSTKECISASPASVSVYTVTVVDGCGSTTTANTTVYTEPTPTVNMNVNFSQGCVPFCVQFLNASNVSKGKIEQYVWNFGDGDSSHTKQPVYCYKTSGEYDVSLTVVSDSGCSATLKRVDMVTIYGPPKAAFTYSPQPASIETPRVQFIDKSTDAYGIAYQWWAFGDESDSTSNAVNPVHTYHDTGTYCATLIVMNNGGCMDTVTNCLVIEPAFKLYIPSAFTPNGDGRNEVFQAIGQYVKSFEMYVFDRWGMELFHSTSLNQGWNGTYKGGISQEDVYVYKITVTDSEDNEHSYVGNVTLIK